MCVENMHDKRFIYAILETSTDDNGNYIPVIVFEGEDHYHATDWTWGKDIERARQCATKMNTDLGISENDAETILRRSMFGGKE